MPSVIAVTSDLIFSTRIVGTAKSLGIGAVSVSALSVLASNLDTGEVRLVMVDMDLPVDRAGEAIRLAAAHPSKPHVVAYYSHVRADLRDTAQQAGAMEILPRSAFVEQLPALLRRYANDGEKQVN